MAGKVRVVDVHYHITSPELAKQIATCVPVPSRYDPQKNILRTGTGTEAQLLTEEEQLANMVEDGIDALCVSVRTPLFFDRGVLPPSSPHWLTLARTINDYLADMCRRYPGRFMAFADIPLTAGDAAIEEMVRALNKLGLHGISLQSNYGKPLDAPEFRPFFAEANRQRAVTNIHPIFPIGTEKVLLDYYMYAIVGFPYETTLTMGRLASAGVLEQYPDITFILSHAGGTIPFLWWRMDFAYEEGWPGSRDHLTAPPSKYLARCYYDTALTDTEALMLTYRRVGDHLMLGTDRPYRKNAVRETWKAVKAMDIPDEVKAKILGGNALMLLRRPGRS